MSVVEAPASDADEDATTTTVATSAVCRRPLLSLRLPLLGVMIVGAIRMMLGDD